MNADTFLSTFTVAFAWTLAAVVSVTLLTLVIMLYVHLVCKYEEWQYYRETAKKKNDER